ncbi:MAG: glycosyltransferase family 1 protein [Cyanobacteria bacterium P01_H01_bin.58]
MHVLIPALHRPTKPTGVCRHAVNLAQCLAEATHVDRVTLLIGEWQKDYFERSFELASSKIQTATVNIPNTSRSRNLWYLFGLPKVAEQLNPDIIHMSFPFPFVRRWFQATVLATIHDLYPYEYPENFGYPRVWFNQLFLQQCVSNSDGLSCVSQCTLDTLKHYFPSAVNCKPTAVIYNVVDFGQVVAKCPHQLINGGKIPFLLTVAQHRKNKNLNILIEAYDRLLQQGALKPEMRLFLVGSSGPETISLTEQVKRLDLQEQVVFLAGLEDAELRWLYENASLFVIPSATEGFCLPLVEALNCNCPVVCSDIPIFREVGGSRCIYFPLTENAVNNLATAITRQIDCPAAYSNELEVRFSKANVSQELLSFYQILSALS